MVITGGANVYPAEVEAVLVRHPDIAEVAVIGVPDDEYGEIVTAIVVAEAGCADRRRRDRVRARASRPYKAPRRVELVDALPRDPMGKIRKRDLRTSTPDPPLVAHPRRTDASGVGQARRSTIIAMPWPPPTHMVSRP